MVKAHANGAFECVSHALIFWAKVESELLPNKRRGKGILWPLTGTVGSWQPGQTSDSQMFQTASNVQPRPDSPKAAHWVCSSQSDQLEPDSFALIVGSDSPSCPQTCLLTCINMHLMQDVILWILSAPNRLQLTRLELFPSNQQTHTYATSSMPARAPNVNPIQKKGKRANKWRRRSSVSVLTASWPSLAQTVTSGLDCPDKPVWTKYWFCCGDVCQLSACVRSICVCSLL